MKCPKCGYIGFEAVDRCRNCGYEFSLAVTAPHRDDLEMRTGSDPIGPLADLSLKAAPQARRRTPGTELDLDRIIGAPESSADLPLFNAEALDTLETPPLISAPAAPRKPLAVRRVATPPARPRESREQTPASRDNLELPLPVSATELALSAGEHEIGTAAPAPRVFAALLDTLLLAGLDLLVLYFTIRLCSLTMADMGLLPVPPFLAFLLLLNGGYLVAFTAAGGQTIGKMAFGLKVVGADDSSVPVATATLRALAALASTVCLGAGLVPALFGGRAIHDRIADTRVVHLTH